VGFITLIGTILLGETVDKHLATSYPFLVTIELPEQTPWNPPKRIEEPYPKTMDFELRETFSLFGDKSFDLENRNYLLNLFLTRIFSSYINRVLINCSCSWH